MIKWMQYFKVVIKVDQMRSAMKKNPSVYSKV